MRRLLLLFVLAAGCAEESHAHNPPNYGVAAPPADPIENLSWRASAGCRSEAECWGHYREAQGLMPMCLAQSDGVCPAMTWVMSTSEQRARWFEGQRLEQTRRAEAARWEAQRRAEEEARQRAAAEAIQREADRLQAEARRAEEEYDQARRDVADNRTACEVKHEESACAVLSAFTARYPSDAKTAELAAIVQKHSDFVAARDRRTGGGRAPAASVEGDSAPSGRVCCCDGTVSPTCTYVKRGCCSHHGGVCACN
jgi:hypothetical protein